MSLEDGCWSLTSFIAWLLTLECLGSLNAKSKENTSTKFIYLLKIFIKASLAIKPAIWGLWEGWTILSGVEFRDARKPKNAMWTTKVLYSGSSAAIANSFFFTNSMHLVVERAFSVVSIFQRSFQSKKLTSAPLKLRKSIPRTIFKLTLATRKVFQKILSNLLYQL